MEAPHFLRGKLWRFNLSLECLFFVFPFLRGFSISKLSFLFFRLYSGQFLQLVSSSRESGNFANLSQGYDLSLFTDEVCLYLYLGQSVVTSSALLNHPVHIVVSYGTRAPPNVYSQNYGLWVLDQIILISFVLSGSRFSNCSCQCQLRFKQDSKWSLWQRFYFPFGGPLRERTCISSLLCLAEEGSQTWMRFWVLLREFLKQFLDFLQG